MQGRTPRFLQDVVESCLCGTCGPDNNGTCTDKQSSPNKPISVTVKWIVEAENPPDMLYVRFQNGKGKCSVNVTVTKTPGGSNDTYFITPKESSDNTGEICGVGGNNIVIYEDYPIIDKGPNSSPKKGVVHISCSDPLFVGLEFGPDSTSNNGCVDPFGQDQVCNCGGGDCNFEVLGGCVADPANATGPALCIGDQTGNSGEDCDPTCVSFLTID